MYKELFHVLLATHKKAVFSYCISHGATLGSTGDVILAGDHLDNCRDKLESLGRERKGSMGWPPQSLPTVTPAGKVKKK